MSELLIKKGNIKVEDIPVYDKDGDLITNLATATDGRFDIKSQETGAVLVSKTIGAGIDIDTPVVGYIRLTLTPTDTDQTPGYYYMGLQFMWGANDVRECYIKIEDIVTEKLKITQDIVNT
jgi:hypothetical protein